MSAILKIIASFDSNDSAMSAKRNLPWISVIAGGDGALRGLMEMKNVKFLDEEQSIMSWESHHLNNTCAKPWTIQGSRAVVKMEP